MLFTKCAETQTKPNYRKQIKLLEKIKILQDGFKGKIRTLTWTGITRFTKACESREYVQVKNHHEKLCNVGLDKLCVIWLKILMLLPEVESRTEGSRQRTQKNPRPRTAPPRTDTLEAKDRNARGQGPGTQTQVFSIKKKIFKKIFQAISKKMV